MAVCFDPFRPLLAHEWHDSGRTLCIVTTHEFRRDEAWAAGIVASVTGATVTPLDVPGAPDRTPDARLTYPDGRKAVLEITTLADPAELQLHNLVRRVDWPAPGEWSWLVNVGSPQELPKVEAVYARAIELMERLGVKTVDELDLELIDGDDDLTWLATESESTFHGWDGGSPARVHVSPSGAFAVWDNASDEVSASLAAAFEQEPIASHVAKLLEHEDDERHLFLITHTTGLGPAAAFALIEPKAVPSSDPPAPDGITHVWLASGWGQVVTVWERGPGWSLRQYG